MVRAALRASRCRPRGATRFKRAFLALVEAAEGTLLVPEILHFAAVAADQGGGLLPLLGDPLPVFTGVPESGEGVVARDARKECHDALGLSGGAFLRDGGAAGDLQFGKRLAFFAMNGGKIAAFFVKLFAPLGVRLIQASRRSCGVS